MEKMKEAETRIINECRKNRKKGDRTRGGPHSVIRRKEEFDRSHGAQRGSQSRDRIQSVYSR